MGKNFRLHFEGNLKLAAFDITVTLLLHSNSLTNAARKVGYALDVADERKYCHHNDNCSKMEICSSCNQSPLLNMGKCHKNTEVVGNFKGQLFSLGAGVFVAFSKLIQSLSVTGIRGSATMLLARATWLTNVYSKYSHKQKESCLIHCKLISRGIDNFYIKKSEKLSSLFW